MVVFPNAKINLGLNILQKRPDNFHDIQTIFYPVMIKDVLEVVENEKFEFINTGLKIDAPAEKNLVVKAYFLLKKDFNLPEVKIHLHKIIPFGAGLGGGSADAAFMIKLLNEMFNLSLSDKKMMNYAKFLGSDCAFFILNQPALGSQKGDVLEKIELDLSDYKIIVIKPYVQLNTAKVYSYITPNKNVEDLRILINKPIETWKKTIKNDFEKVVFSRHHEIADIKNLMYKNGALFSSMSGSGSSVFGIFKRD
ncbi:MAG: 4-(cytidine 5'-diphospho)-2-C-methyl-D-erythritol kinase, partial [Bacteroidales bacterium]|nr:4-(cytidine 5'-diphospho)-2-C-methyl-D-erythritol kinase [Bacteroidales bacterium]